MTENSNPILNDELMNEWSSFIADNKLELEKQYYDTKDELEKLFEKNHEELGRLLKCHLIIESFINKFLDFELKISQANNLNLRFAQKVSLIECMRPELKFFLKGIREINAMRNKIAHNLHHEINASTLDSVKYIASWIHSKSSEDQHELIHPIDFIEKYTHIFCHILDGHSNEEGKKRYATERQIFSKYK